MPSIFTSERDDYNPYHSSMHLILFLAWLLTLGVSLLIDLNLFADHPPLKLTLRLTSSFLLVVAGCYTIIRIAIPWRSIAILVALGMFFGFLGDCAMAGLFTFIPNPVIGGMLFFGIGHIAYITAALMTRRRLAMPAGSRWWLAIAIWQVVGILIWLMVVARSDKHLPLHYPALVYGALLAATAGLSSALALLDRRFCWVALGAALFLFSDGAIAWGMFQESTPVMRFLVWATYGPGQMLIVFGFACVFQLQESPAPQAQVAMESLSKRV